MPEHPEEARGSADRVRNRERAPADADGSGQRLEAVTRGIGDGFVTLDLEWRYVAINDPACEALGMRREEILGRTIWELYPGTIGTRFEAELRRSVAEQKPSAFECFYPGRDHWYENRLYPSAAGLSIFFADQTERKRAEDALRESERRVVAILESMTDGYYTLDRGWRFSYINPQAEPLLGRSRAELLGRTVWEEFPEVVGTVLDREYRRAVAERVPVAFEMHYPPLGRWFSVHTHPSDDGLSAYFSDITERKRAEERLRELSRRLIRAQEEERRHLARELHDEIGQALTAVSLNVQVALRDPSDPAAARRLEECLALVQRTIGQVRDLSLDLRPSILDDLGLVDALRSYVSGFVQRSGIAAQLVAEEEIGPLGQELETACYRIAQEALTNVVRHAGAGRVRVGLSRSASELRLSVADDGSGFDVEAATARAAGGSSLGMLSMRERAMLVGGRVEITSGLGRGTEIRAMFPLACDRSYADSRPDESSRDSAGWRTKGPSS